MDSKIQTGILDQGALLSRRDLLAGMTTAVSHIGKASTADSNLAPAVIRVPSPRLVASLTRLMDVAMLPGCGMAVISGGKTVWKHFQGVADAQTKTPIANNTIFVGCSLGKPIFAYAVLRLVEEGRIELDKPLSDYLASDAPTGAFGRKVTARHVLTHTSGFVNWRQGNDEKLTSTFAPGSKFQYSGEGFYTLQRCIEKIVGMSFESFIQSYLLKRLGMHSTTYLWSADMEARLVSGHTSTKAPIRRFWNFNKRLFKKIAESGVPLEQWNHDRIVKEMADPNAPMPNSISPNVAFGLLTSLDDYTKFVQRLTHTVGDGLDLKPETLKLMQERKSHINSELGWGVGIGIEQQGRHIYQWQWGDNGFWKNLLLIHPETHTGIVIFTNGANGMRVIERIVRDVSSMEHDLFLWA